ncbi:hypothetical protein Poli38472_000618 [Pythium oligandrum]|uniref:RCC1-like domain-containing protein n=1 Tax=Pythium oligandrum TaxID=41045 RepID=A0A8K1CC24_PYTOL|nr:hypothetical protein Poli38472_000618 [Pythium oligandrum]|eukprot:TMW60576.1 hypothetical protein Poli38472_000618 [Pythium oligandrum]
MTTHTALHANDMLVECAVITFGCNDDGQLARGERRRWTSIDDVTAANFPQQVGALRGHDVVAASCGSRHSMVLTSRGEVFSWGWGAMGQLGHGTLKSSNAPHRIHFFQEVGLVVQYISCGGCHSGAVTSEGDLYMWGEAHWGQLGLPKEHVETYEPIPTKCQVLDDNGQPVKIVKLSCGGAHTAALTDEGDVYMWGRCDSGQLGVGAKWIRDAGGEGALYVSTPHRVDGFNGEKVVQVACGAFHSAAITESGAVYIWGKEDYGMLGVGQTSDIHTPQRLEFFDSKPALRVSCGGWHTVVVTKAGECYSFGRGEYGRLGLGNTRSKYRPHLVEALKGQHVVQAACGGSHTLFLTTEGIAYTAGRADHGRLGHADMKTSLVPVPIEQSSMGAIPVRQVSAGGAHSIALLHSTRPLVSPLISPTSLSPDVPQKTLL